MVFTLLSTPPGPGSLASANVPEPSSASPLAVIEPLAWFTPPPLAFSVTMPAVLRVPAPGVTRVSMFCSSPIWFAPLAGPPVPLPRITLPPRVWMPDRPATEVTVSPSPSE